MKSCMIFAAFLAVAFSSRAADIGNGSPPTPIDDCEVGTLSPGVHPATVALALGMGDMAGNASQPTAQAVFYAGGFTESFAAAETVTFRRQGFLARFRANRQARVAARRGASFAVESAPVHTVQFVPPPMQSQAVQAPVPTLAAPQPMFREECVIINGRRQCFLVPVR